MIRKAFTSSLAFLLLTGFAFAQDKKEKAAETTKKEGSATTCKTKTKSCCQQPSKAASLAKKGKKS